MLKILSLSVLVAFATPLGALAQASLAASPVAVSATSGDPARIGAIRAEFAAIQHDLSSYRMVFRNLPGYALEGSEVTGAFEGDTLRKLSVRHYGESWRGTEEHYLRDGELVFSYIVHEIYKEGAPMSGKVQARIEHRFYFDGEQLIRRIRTVFPSRHPQDFMERDPRLENVRRDVAAYAACVKARGAEPKECVGPG